METNYNIVEIDGKRYFNSSFTGMIECPKSEEFKPVTRKIPLIKVNRDIYGNPRVVCHFLEFINERDEEEANEKEKQGYSRILYLFNIALKKAHKIGGSKYRGKDYGGGIVFQCYNERELSERINEIKGE